MEGKTLKIINKKTNQPKNIEELDIVESTEDKFYQIHRIYTSEYGYQFIAVCLNSTAYSLIGYDENCRTAQELYHFLETDHCDIKAIHKSSETQLTLENL